MRRKYWYNCALVFLLVFFLNACDLHDGEVIIETDKETFEKERMLWNSQNITNYQFTYDFFHGAGPRGPLTITIRDNKTYSIKNQNQYNDSTIAESIPQIYEFINETFEKIETVKNGTYTGFKIEAITLSIEYNTHYHYPTKVHFGTRYEGSVNGGGYYTLNITEFIPLN